MSVDLTYDQFQELVAHRGGCNCAWLTRPPCSACTDPCTQAEAEELGFVKPDELDSPHMKAVRDLCR